MLNYEEKFIVINKKHLEELNTDFQNRNSFNKTNLKDHPQSEKLLESINSFKRTYEGCFNKKLNQKYYVCNQDEPYAKDIIEIILAEKNKKVENLIEGLEKCARQFYKYYKIHKEKNNIEKAQTNFNFYMGIKNLLEDVEEKTLNDLDILEE